MDEWETDQATTTQTTFCAHCGVRTSGGAFCSACGSPLAQDNADALAEAATSELAAAEPRVRDLRARAGYDADPTSRVRVPRAPAGPYGPASPPVVPSLDRGRRWGPIVALIALVLVAGAAAAIYFATRSSGTKSSDADAVYRHRVAATFGPVLGSNRNVSHALAALSGGQASEAKQAVRQAQGAVSTAQGALGELKVPSSAGQLASQARQALAREASYYNAVAAVLNDPKNVSAGEVQTLASNVTSALAAGGATLAGTSSTISGAENLTTWAHRAARAKPRHHSGASSSASTSGGSGTASGGTSSSAPSNPYANGRDCGGGVFAGPNTSCDFAFNVREAYDNAPGAAASVEVFSPVTGQTYTMSCAPAGDGITCSGGNDASVTFGL